MTGLLYQNRVLRSILISVPLLLSTTAWALDDFMPGNRFFTVNETPAQDQRFNGPVINLLNWTEHQTPPPRPQVKYNRANQFGAWLVRNQNNNCYDTRALVLIRESKKPTTPWSVDPCYISGGAWHDPYTNLKFTDAQKVQIDHLIALKNAYISGAFEWDNKTRCAYANFLGNRYHLIPVDASTNMRKGDQTPARWLPPNAKFRCSYLSAWLRIKTIWRLRMAEDEAQAIFQQAQEFRCNMDEFKMPLQELNEQRQLVSKGIAECPNTPPRPRIPPRTQATPTERWTIEYDDFLFDSLP